MLVTENPARWSYTAGRRHTSPMPAVALEITGATGEISCTAVEMFSMLSGTRRPFKNDPSQSRFFSRHVIRINPYFTRRLPGDRHLPCANNCTERDPAIWIEVTVYLIDPAIWVSLRPPKQALRKNWFHF